jgi:hypothetical protein
MPAPATLGVQQYVESICQSLNNEGKTSPRFGNGKENAARFSQLSFSAVLIIH